MFATYDAKNCSVIVDGVYITGLSESMISCEKDEEFFSTSVGAQGDVVKSVTNNDLGTITVTVQSTCPQKAFLTSLAKRDEPFSIWIINKPLGERIGGTMANLKNYPSIEREAEAGDMEYEFQVFDYIVEETK